MTAHTMLMFSTKHLKQNFELRSYDPISVALYTTTQTERIALLLVVVVVLARKFTTIGNFCACTLFMLMYCLLYKCKSAKVQLGCLVVTHTHIYYYCLPFTYKMHATFNVQESNRTVIRVYLCTAFTLHDNIFL